MNYFKLSDADRVKALQAVLLGMVAGHIAVSLYTRSMVKKIIKQHNLNIRKMRVAGRIIDEFIKNADPELVQKIVSKYEFEWVVADIDPDEVKVEDYIDPQL